MISTRARQEVCNQGASLGDPLLIAWLRLEIGEEVVALVIVRGVVERRGARACATALKTCRGLRLVRLVVARAIDAVLHELGPSKLCIQAVDVGAKRLSLSETGVGRARDAFEGVAVISRGS